MADLFDELAQRVEAEKVDSDSYLLDQVFPSITDDQFAAVIGIHGFILPSNLQVDPKTQKIEGVLNHQEQSIDVELVVKGSYARPDDGEWSVCVNRMESLEDPLCAHAPFDYDPETDAVNIMHALTRLLRQIAGIEDDETEETSEIEEPESE